MILAVTMEIEISALSVKSHPLTSHFWFYQPLASQTLYSGKVSPTVNNTYGEESLIKF